MEINANPAWQVYRISSSKKSNEHQNSTQTVATELRQAVPLVDEHH
jgi:hypothetical protein